MGYIYLAAGVCGLAAVLIWCLVDRGSAEPAGLGEQDNPLDAAGAVYAGGLATRATAIHASTGQTTELISPGATSAAFTNSQPLKGRTGELTRASEDTMGGQR